MAKRPKKFLMSRNPKINGNSFVGIVSKNFEKVPKIIPINNIHTVFMICLLRGIGFSALLISFKNFFILYPYNFRFVCLIEYHNRTLFLWMFFHILQKLRCPWPVFNTPVFKVPFLHVIVALEINIIYFFVMHYKICREIINGSIPLSYQKYTHKSIKYYLLFGGV